MMAKIIASSVARLILLSLALGVTSWWLGVSRLVSGWAASNATVVGAGVVAWLALCHFVWDAKLHRDEIAFDLILGDARRRWMMERTRGQR
jgi:hypothetical protein